MRFPLATQQFDAIVDFYGRHGFVVLTGVDPALAGGFRRVIRRITGLTDEQIHRAGMDDEIVRLPTEVRAQLARPEMTPELQDLMLATLGDLVVRLIGPLVHVGNSYHPQIKRTRSTHILKGYSGDGLEVEAPYGLHQDFTAARVVTSPNAIVCWMPLNTCEYSALRLYSTSATRGLLTNRWLRFDERGVEHLGPSVEVKAREGEVLLFNFMLMHGTTLPGPGTRISCDARFLPYCGILDSTPTVLRPDPLEWIRARLVEPAGDILTAPLYETLAYLGEPIDWPEIRPRSAVHWARYVEGLVSGDSARMSAAIEQFANVEEGFDGLASYLERFLGLTLQARPYRSVSAALPPLARARCQAMAERAAALAVSPA